MESLGLLVTAVGRSPGQQPQPRAAEPAAPREAAASGEKSRFGINSLINRMTGSGSEGAQGGARPARQQPPVQSRQAPQEDAYEDEDDQIEIPAFLRRQAN